MSVKIYEAFKYPVNNNLQEFQKIVELIRNKFEYVFIENFVNEIVKDSVTEYDSRKIIESRKDLKDYKEITNKCSLVSVKKQKHEKLNNGNYSCTVNFFLDKEYVYIIFFSNCYENDYSNSLQDISNLEDFSYFDNTDEQLNYLTYNEWKSRLKKWEELVPENRSFKDSSLEIYIPSSFIHTSTIEIYRNLEDYIPDFETRLNNLIEKFVKNIPPNWLQEKFISGSENGYFPFMEYQNWLKSNEFKQRAKKEKECFSQLIQKNIRIQDLKNDDRER